MTDPTVETIPTGSHRHACMRATCQRCGRQFTARGATIETTEIMARMLRDVHECTIAGQANVFRHRLWATMRESWRLFHPSTRRFLVGCVVVSWTVAAWFAVRRWRGES